MYYNFKKHIKTISILILLILCSSVYGQEGSVKNQPFSSYWFVSDLLNWDPSIDPHAPFNTSEIPLRNRFVDKETQIRPELKNDPSIMALIASHPTSFHPSQGFQSIKHYSFPYWQYVDHMIQWGGSSNEGIIVAPSKPWIDAAHLNGVETYGTVFFPPNVYGGKEDWVKEFLSKGEADDFPLADKLIEVARLYGFDGWFINQETHGLSQKEAQLMRDFLAYYQRKSAGKEQIVWYDAMIEDGRVIWQDEFNQHNAFFFRSDDQKLSDQLFIDFGWSATNLEDSRIYVENLNRTSWELFAGIDVQSKSYKTYVNWDALYDRDEKPYTTSIGLYWPNSTFDISHTKEPEEVYINDQIFWNGGYQEETPHGQSLEWKGFANYFPARSVLSEVPFITSFNYGLGRFFNINGHQVSSQEWHNLSLQDILPTWQWVTDTTQAKPTISF